MEKRTFAKDVCVMSIEPDLKKIHNNVMQMRADIVNGWNRRGLSYSSFPDKEILERTVQILEDQLIDLVVQAGYYKRKYMKHITVFIDKEADYLIENIQHKDRLDASIKLVNEAMQHVAVRVVNRSKLVRKNKRHEWIRFWIPVAISILALTISVATVIFSENDL